MPIRTPLLGLAQDHTKYTGVIQLLNQGDVIKMYIHRDCTFDHDHFHLGETFLGALFVSFNFLDTDGPPVTNQYGSNYGGMSNGTFNKCFDKNGLGMQSRFIFRFMEKCVAPWGCISQFLRSYYSKTRSLFCIRTAGISAL